MNLATEPVFAPSEWVFLYGQRFAAPGSWVDKIQLTHSGAEVSARSLARAIWLTALLANEQAGAVRLEERQKSMLLGLFKSQVCFAELTGAQIAWPAYTLEAALLSLLPSQASQQRNAVSHLVYLTLPHDCANPWLALIEQIKVGLAERGLLEFQEKSPALIARGSRYRLTAVAAERVAQTPPVELARWLGDETPLLAARRKALNEQIENGLKRRLEQSTSV